MDVMVKIFKEGGPIAVKVNIYTLYDTVEGAELVTMLQKHVAKLVKKKGWVVC